MDWTSVVVALITALGSFVAVYISNRKSAALLEYRMTQLERKVETHNNLISRTYRLEEGQAVLDEKLKVANNRLSDLERLERKGA